MKKLTAAWARNAEDGFCAGAILVGGSRVFKDHVCYYSRKSAEKYLRALLQERGLVARRRATLDDYLTALVPLEPSLKSLRRGVGFLSAFDIDTLYPGKHATKRQAQSAIRWAERVRAAARDLLGL
jgi:HEPN domain-containing protein